MTSRFRKGRFLLAITMFSFSAFCASAMMVWAETGTIKERTPSQSEYVVIGWNDLGMHCISPSFRELAILPPYNNLWSQVIRRGDPPELATAGVILEYSIINNAAVTGKSDFWQYVGQLFGVNLTEGIGLTGNGLSGRMKLVGDHFEATALPVLPYDDKMNWNPYQIALIKVKNVSGTVLETIRVVLPVSDELNCAKCHAQGMDATVNLPDGGVASTDTNILAVHDFYHGINGQSTVGPNLLDIRPVLCASCHSDNALGAPGDGQSKPLSQVMHGWHSQFPDAGCYDCHPGAKTRCMRTGIGGMGYSGTEPSCPTCHGDLVQVAQSISQGRQPWLQEPSCEQCHGINKTTGQNLYRNSKGHGGIYCSACHNSPHAWWPSKLLADNRQPLALQDRSSSLGNCLICHKTKPQGHNNNPHVTLLRDPYIATMPDGLDFENVKAGRRAMRTLTIVNRGTRSLKIQGLEIVGSDASMFQVDGDISVTLPPGTRIRCTLVFKPASEGTKIAALNINSSDPNVSTLEVSLTGNGW